MPVCQTSSARIGFLGENHIANRPGHLHAVHLHAVYRPFMFDIIEVHESKGWHSKLVLFVRHLAHCGHPKLQTLATICQLGAYSANTPVDQNDDKRCSLGRL